MMAQRVVWRKQPLSTTPLFWSIMLCTGYLRSSGSCPDLSVPSYGVLNFNGSDVTQSQPGSYPENSTVEYACATGYRLINAATGVEQALTSTTCLVNGTWTLEGVACLSKKKGFKCHILLYTYRLK